MSDKLPKVKHNHTLTDILKASIFSLVMMAPIAAIGVTCAYVVCNKNANQSYSGNETIQTEYVRTNNSFIIGEEYYFNSRSFTTLPNSLGAANNRIYFNNLEVIANQTNINISTITSLAFYKESNTQYYYIYAYDENNNTILSAQRGDTNNIILKFNYLSNNLTSSVLDDTNFFYSTNNLSYNYMDNVFYYAVDTMQNNTLFSWTKTTAIYTPINAMTTGMGINTPAIAVLLTYWMLLTAMYVIIDIVIKGFTWMTHLIGER